MRAVSRTKEGWPQSPDFRGKQKSFSVVENRSPNISFLKYRLASFHISSPNEIFWPIAHKNGSRNRNLWLLRPDGVIKELIFRVRATALGGERRKEQKQRKADSLSDCFQYCGAFSIEIFDRLPRKFVAGEFLIVATS